MVRTARKRELRGILMERRREIAGEVMRKLHDIRADGIERSERGHAKSGNELNDENVDISVREDIDLALIQMKADMLNKIDQALGRLDRNVYGNCLACNGQIAEKRLRALPFAIRCKDCEEALEKVQTEDKKLKRGYGFVLVDPAYLFLD